MAIVAAAVVVLAALLANGPSAAALRIPLAEAPTEAPADSNIDASDQQNRPFRAGLESFTTRVIETWHGDKSAKADLNPLARQILYGLRLYYLQKEWCVWVLHAPNPISLTNKERFGVHTMPACYQNNGPGCTEQGVMWKESMNAGWATVSWVLFWTPQTVLIDLEHLREMFQSTAHRCLEGDPTFNSDYPRLAQCIQDTSGMLAALVYVENVNLLGHDGAGYAQGTIIDITISRGSAGDIFVRVLPTLKWYKQTSLPLEKEGGD